MADAHRNFAKGTLTNSPGTAGTSFVLGSGEGALFAANMPVTIVPASTQPDSSNAEIGYVTAVATDTLTVTRAQESTTAKNAVAGWLVLGTVTAKSLTDIETDVTAAKARANHTGTQTASTISDFSASADARITAATGVTVQGYNASTTTLGNTTTGTGSIVRATSPTLVTPALGTPASATLTNATGLPVAGITSSTTTALGVGSLELGHATDTTLSRSSAGVLAVEGVVVPTVSSTSTLTNKTLTAPRLASGGFIADANGNELIIGTTTASAVNEITVMNNATANDPRISATGGDTNINLELQGKGTGAVTHGNTGVVVYGNASTPATPASNAGKIWMSGTSSTRPKFTNGSGTVEQIITTNDIKRQDNTTNSSPTTYRREIGWGYIAHPGGSNTMSETVTFSAAFTSVPIIQVSFGGDHGSGTTLGSGGNVLVGKMNIKHHTNSTTGFTVKMDTGDGAAAAAGNYFYTWSAEGA